MKYYKIQLFFIVICFFLVAGLVACEDSEDNEEDDEQNEDDTGNDDDDVEDDDNDDGPSSDDDDDGSSQISGIVLDYVSMNPILGAVVELLDNSTGDPFSPPVTATSNIDGYVMLTAPDGHDVVAAETRAIDFVDTRKHFYVVGESGHVFWGISSVAEALFEALLAVEFDPEKSKIIGEMLWRKADGETEPVGCAGGLIYPNPGSSYGGVFYFSDTNLPSLIQEHTNPSNGRYLAPNINPVDYYTVISVVEGMIEATYIPLFFQNVFVIVDIFFDESEYPLNPTPMECS